MLIPNTTPPKYAVVAMVTAPDAPVSPHVTGDLANDLISSARRRVRAAAEASGLFDAEIGLFYFDGAPRWYAYAYPSNTPGRRDCLDLCGDGFRLGAGSLAEMEQTVADALAARVALSGARL